MDPTAKQWAIACRWLMAKLHDGAWNSAHPEAPFAVNVTMTLASEDDWDAFQVLDLALVLVADELPPLVKEPLPDFASWQALNPNPPQVLNR